MALRHIVSFAQLPTTPFNLPVLVDFAPGLNRKLRGTPLYLYNNWPVLTNQYSSNIQPNQVYQQDGYLWLKRGWVSSNNNPQLVNPYSKASFYAALNEIVTNLSATSKFGFGFRGRIKDYLRHPVGVLHTAAVALSTTIYVFPVADIPAFKADAPYYFEVEVDFAKLVINRWVDGVALTPLALTAAQVTALVTSGFFSFNSPQQITIDTYNAGNGANPTADMANNALVGFRDIYAWEDTGDDSINKRLGPQIVSPLAPVAADSTDWVATPTGKSILETLNLPYTNVGIDGDQATYVSAGLSLTPVVLKFAPVKLMAGQKINGLTLNVAAWRPAGTAGVLQSQVQVDQAKALVKIHDVAATPNYSLSVGVFEKAPDGAAWTTDSVGKTTLTLAPVFGS